MVVIGLYLVHFSRDLRAQREKESGSATLGAFRPNFAKVAPDDALDSCQPNPQAFKVSSWVQALKGNEQFSGLGHIEPRPVIFYKIGFAFLPGH
jgi:hypothetical protein